MKPKAMPKTLCKTLLLVGLIVIGDVQAVRGQIGNLLGFDQSLTHFGIQVGYSCSKFDMELNQAEDIHEVSLGATSYYTAGFHISVIGDLRLGHFFNVRALPGIVLLNREITYNWTSEYLQKERKIEGKRSVESVYGELPIEIKFRAMRWGDMRPYVTAGTAYAFDFASLRKNKNNEQEVIIRLNPHELSYSMGVGVDFFLHYVKFAIEFKQIFGINNLLVTDKEIYTQVPNSLHSRSYMLSFTFEG